MDALHRLSAMVVADLRRRTREPRFWWLCALLVVGAWFCLPLSLILRAITRACA
ncbi:MAG: hypothetical protein ACK5VV_14330 [Lysobacteraceae bacterium]